MIAFLLLIPVNVALISGGVAPEPSTGNVADYYLYVELGVMVLLSLGYSMELPFFNGRTERLFGYSLWSFSSFIFLHAVTG